MTETFGAFLMIVTYLIGLVTGYIIWAPMSNFKRGFVDGITLRFIWKR